MCGRLPKIVSVRGILVRRTSVWSTWEFLHLKNEMFAWSCLNLFVASVSPLLDRIDARGFPFDKEIRSGSVICKLM